MPVRAPEGPRSMAAVTRSAHDEPATRAALHALGCADAMALSLGGIRARELADRFGTPLYVFVAELLDRRLLAVRRALGESFTVLYSVKANPSLAVTARLCRLGAGAEVASLGELQLAIAAGHAPERLRFAGPGKSDAEIDAALRLHVGCFHAESAGEVAAIAAAARARGRTAGVALRINLPHELAGSRLRMGGGSSRFGVDADQAPALLAAIAAAPELHLRGLHVYGGTQSFDAAACVRHGAALCDQAAAFERELGLHLDELDLGGGFGVPAYAGDPEFDLAAAGAGLAELAARHARPGRSWFVELGRYLVAPCGVYLTRVVREKQSGGQRHLVLDGGLHHHAAACGAGTVLKRPPLLVAAGALRGAAAAPVTLGGPLCTPADQLAEQVLLPELGPGDLVAVLDAGAYGLSFSPHGFL
ncbi:MAG: diaminopimelate decarboxylase, partial [Planctomycetes bacterium]|nr:diaminopimelate decarboxylase [Planctomycetota bacterium]